MAGFAVAVEAMHTLGTISQKVDPQALVDLNNLSGQ